MRSTACLLDERIADLPQVIFQVVMDAAGAEVLETGFWEEDDIGEWVELAPAEGDLAYPLAWSWCLEEGWFEWYVLDAPFDPTAEIGVALSELEPGEQHWYALSSVDAFGAGDVTGTAGAITP
jgi:hypothetical protein